VNNQGQLVSKIGSVRRLWTNLYEEHEFTGDVNVNLYQCEDEDPPTRKTATVHLVGTYTYKLDTPYRALPSFNSELEVPTKQLDFEFELVPSGASVEISLYFDGRKQSGQHSNFRFK
jgi:hypothetical protein